MTPVRMSQKAHLALVEEARYRQRYPAPARLSQYERPDRQIKAAEAEGREYDRAVSRWPYLASENAANSARDEISVAGQLLGEVR